MNTMVIMRSYRIRFEALAVSVSATSYLLWT